MGANRVRLHQLTAICWIRRNAEEQPKTQDAGNCKNPTPYLRHTALELEALCNIYSAKTQQALLNNPVPNTQKAWIRNELGID